jgi:hypothetical protein
MEVIKAILNYGYAIAGSILFSALVFLLFATLIPFYFVLDALQYMKDKVSVD